MDRTMRDPTLIITAGWVAPMDRAAYRDGAVVVSRGRVIDVGGARDLATAHRGADLIDLPRSVLLPGLVNAHTHLELSTCRAGDSPGAHFGEWILGIRKQLAAQGEDFEGVVSGAVREGVRQSLRFGVTTIGDISQQNHFTRPALRALPVRCVSYGETLGLAKQRARHDELLARALDATHRSERLRIGLTPHASYTVDLRDYRTCLRVARERNLPLATHLAENPQEREFLEHQTGLFRDIWESLSMWDDTVQTYRGSPVAFAHAIGLLEYPTLLAHVNYCDDDELDLLARGRASVVYCPRTHAYFGHAPHRWREMLSRGVNVAVGTDSCASSPDLNLVDDLRLLRTSAPDVPAEALWEMATVRAARAIRMDDEVGAIARGKRADLVAFDADRLDPFESVLRDAREPTHVWFGGALTPAAPDFPAPTSPG
jgi:cytosine/adenosine deaminase-related metal-dependent hydrolase